MGGVSSRTPDATAAVAAEFLGALLLVATIVGSGIMAERLAAGNIAVALLANTIATAGILYVLITILGPVSGAQMNPVVTLVAWMRGELAGARAAAYVPTQILGAICGTLLAHAMYDVPLIEVSVHARSGPAQWLSEVVATFALVLAILGSVRFRPEAVPAVVALTVTAGYWFTASTSFANPAVTLARALTDSFSGIAPLDVPGFLVAQFVGALVARLVAERVFGWRPATAGSAVNARATAPVA